MPQKTRSSATRLLTSHDFWRQSRKLSTATASHGFDYRGSSERTEITSSKSCGLLKVLTMGTVERDTMAHFDQILQHDCEAAPCQNYDAVGRQALRLTASNRRLMVSHPRLLSRIDPELLKTFRSLVAGQDPWPLFLHGEPGVGKTSAALAVADITATASYHGCEELADLTMSRPSDEMKALWDRIAGKDLAILDELGTRERISDLAYTVVKNFSDRREGMPTIFISNVRPEQLRELYDKRIESRLLCGTVFELAGQDRRFAQ